MNKYAGPTNRYTELSGGELDQMDKDYVGNESGLLAARLRFAENVLFPGSGKDNYKVGGKQTLLAFVDEMAGALLDTQQRRKATRRSGSGARSTPSWCTWLSALSRPHS